MEVLGRSAGFEVARDGDRMLFGHRRARAPLIAGLIVSGLALASAAHAILWAGESARTGVILAALALGFGLIAALLLRVWHRRASAPLGDVVVLTADRGTGELRCGDRVVAPLGEVEVEVAKNLADSTQGSMKWVLLSHRRGSERVYTAGRTEAERVAQAIRDWLT